MESRWQRLGVQKSLSRATSSSSLVLCSHEAPPTLPQPLPHTINCISCHGPQNFSVPGIYFPSAALLCLFPVWWAWPPETLQLFPIISSASKKDSLPDRLLTLLPLGVLWFVNQLVDVSTCSWTRAPRAGSQGFSVVCGLRGNMKAAAALVLLMTSLTRGRGWVCSPGPHSSGVVQIDAGHGQVVATNNKNEVFFLSGSTWTRLGSVPLKHVSVGAAGIWGVDNSNKVYKYGGGDFLLSSGQDLKQVDAGGESQVVGVTVSDTIHCLTTAAGWAFRRNKPLNWITFPGQLMYFSCSSYGCWGVNSGQNIYFSKPNSCQGVQWTHVPGGAVKAEVGADGTVFVVTAGGELYQRTGISASVPHGTDWVRIPQSETIKHASYDLGNLWLLTTGGVIMKCTQQGWVCNPGPQHVGATQIEAGQGQVLIRNSNSEVFYLSGSTWNRLGSVHIEQVSVGPAGIWGVDGSQLVMKYVAGDFIPLTGQSMNQVEAGGEGQLVGIIKADSTHCLVRSIASAFNQAGSPNWKAIQTDPLDISCNSQGCWMVTMSQNIIFTKINPNTCEMSAETAMKGLAFVVDAGADGSVFMINTDGELSERTGVSPEFPLGTAWTPIPMVKKITSTSYDQGVLWAINDEGTILKCTK